MKKKFTSVLIFSFHLFCVQPTIAKPEESSQATDKPFADKTISNIIVSNQKYRVSLLFDEIVKEQTKSVVIRVRNDQNNQIKTLYSVLDANFSQQPEAYWSPNGDYFIYINSNTGGLFIYKTMELVKAFEKNNFSQSVFLKNAALSARINLLTDKGNPEFQLLPLNWTTEHTITLSVNRAEKDPLPAFSRKQVTVGHFRYNFLEESLLQLPLSNETKPLGGKSEANNPLGLIGKTRSGTLRPIVVPVFK